MINSIINRKTEDIPLGMLISIIDRAYGTNLDKVAELSRGQVPFLVALIDENHVSQEHLANLFNMNSGTVTRALNKLENNELIIRKTDENNKRRKIISLTKKGELEGKKFKNLSDSMDKNLFKGFSLDEEVEAKKYLRKIAINALELNLE
jgi:DNA-binding MarR family transcriptional regulator